MSRRPAILLTGFEPFGGAASNPSWQAVQAVAEQWQGPADLHIACLPTTFAGSQLALQGLMEEFTPDIAVAVGLAEGRTALTPEWVAINHIDARIPDNEGHQPHDRRVVADGPDGLFTTLPVKTMVAAMQRAGVPATLSYSAGTFVCNTAFYALMHMLQNGPRPAIGGFVHVPATPAERVDGTGPTISLDLITRGLEAGLMACLSNDASPDITTGTIA